MSDEKKAGAKAPAESKLPDLKEASKVQEKKAIETAPIMVVYENKNFGAGVSVIRVTRQNGDTEYLRVVHGKVKVLDNQELVIRQLEKQNFTRVEENQK